MAKQMEFEFGPAPEPKPELTKEYIAHMVKTNRGWARRAVLALYNLQTPDEQSVNSTFIENGKGFNSYDAYTLSEIAKVFLARGLPTSTEWRILHNRLPKYAGQLLKIARSKGNG